MKTINGLTLKEMIISGANNLFNCYPEVDALNVFPVPDRFLMAIPEQI